MIVSCTENCQDSSFFQLLSHVGGKAVANTRI